VSAKENDMSAHQARLNELGISGAIDVATRITRAPEGGSSGTARIPDDEIARKAGRGY
jgi:hypothetical protein